MGENAKKRGLRPADTSAAAESNLGGRTLRPAQCRAYMRKTLAREFPGIVQGFVEGAKSGSCQHVKLVAELLETPGRARKRQSKGVFDRLLDDLEGTGR